MPFVRLLVITDCCLIASCLMMLGILVLLQRHDQQRDHNESRGRHGRHRREDTGIQRAGSTVASLREREYADELRYYPERRL